MLNLISTVQECDARDDDQGIEVGTKNKNLLNDKLNHGKNI